MSISDLLQFAFRTASTGESQNFLGAGWVPASLNSAPRNWRRPLALRFLASSPHYFNRNQRSAFPSTSDFLESEFRRCRVSRELIIDGLVASYMRPDSVCLDYGCGPGFLAVAAAPKVAQVIACDISGGVIACAGVINAAPNIEYRKVAGGQIPAADQSVDLIYSFAVFQHITDDVLSGILVEMHRVMKPGAKAVCHVVINGEGWKTESDWRSDKSFRGRVKWEIGLHCFSRTPESFEQMLTAAGLSLLELKPISTLVMDLANDDIQKQHLSVFARPSHDIKFN